MKPTPKPWTEARLVDKEGNPLRGDTAIAYVTECIKTGGDRDYYAVLATGDDNKPVDRFKPEQKENE